MTRNKYPGQRVSGRHIIQHPLLTRLVWDRLRKGEVKRFTYYATTGDALSAPVGTHKTQYPRVITQEDVP